MTEVASLEEAFGLRGYVGPKRILPASVCGPLLGEIRAQLRQPFAWEKGSAPVSRALFETATRPEILDVVEELIGSDVLLWGATLIGRDPGAVHSWHSDIESCAPDAKTVSVWLGLKDTTPESSLLVVPGSHLFGQTVQEARRELGAAREEATADALVGWARERHGNGEVVVTEVHDGEAVFFDGRLWHGSHNLTERKRYALLLQYATPSTPIRIPDPNSHDWPFRKLEVPRPPCLLVRGSATTETNAIVPAPVTVGKREIRLTSRIHPLRLPLEPDEVTGWRPYQLFRGVTANVPWFKCHTSILSPGASPHEPHAHDDEVLLVVFSGEVELDIDDETLPLGPGEFGHYPAGVSHTMRTTSSEPAQYVIFKWLGDEEPDNDGDTLPGASFGTAGPKRMLFNQQTRWLRKLACHTTVLEPGEGYEPHADSYDVAIVMLEGEVETIGGRAAAHDIVFYLAGEEHGMRSVGDVPARYVVFEFHGRTSKTPTVQENGRSSSAPTLVPTLRRRLRRIARR